MRSNDWSSDVCPMGEQSISLTLISEGESLRGTADTPYGPESFEDGTAKNGTDLAWEFDVRKPMPMTLKFTATVAGDEIDGTVAAGMFGKFEFHGPTS